MSFEKKPFFVSVFLLRSFIKLSDLAAAATATGFFGGFLRLFSLLGRFLCFLGHEYSFLELDFVEKH